MRNTRRSNGRHSVPTPEPRQLARFGPSRRALSWVLGGALLLNLGVVIGLHSVGISVFRSSDATTLPTVASGVVPVADTSALTPARRAIVQILNDGPGPSWAPSGPVTWAAGTAFDFACPANPAAAPVISGARLFTGNGQSVTVTARAYAAGQGAVAFAGLFAAWHNCDQESKGVGVIAAAAPGVDALTGWVSGTTAGGPSSTLMWRRGDVVLTVSHTDTSPNSLASSAYQLDAVADTAIAGICADVSSTLADAARSPWVTQIGYTGLQVAVPVAVTAPTDPAPPPGVTPVPDNAVVSAPPILTLPSQPTGTLLPSALPSPIAVPLIPLRPSPAPSETSALATEQDPVGPGCGWSFTGQAVPQFDAVAAAATLVTAQQRAVASLQAQQSQWQQQTVAFWQQYAAYSTTLAAFTNYVDQVNVIAAAWTTIATNRTQYAAAVVAYNLAVAAQTAFLTQQGQAEAAYNTEVNVCAGSAPPVSASPTALPTASTTSPTPTASPTPTGASPTPTATPTLTPGCPPVRPPILDQPVPSVPPQPSPVP